ncbi:MAG: hypothetical protein JW384_00680 [Nitrosomonadaceae bacterium]|nr:hypothetical protein [Nitrosomonadaceae bacterium]
MTFADGNKYAGEFRDGQANGQGTKTFAEGGKYVGEWRDGERHGQGTYTFAGYANCSQNIGVIIYAAL